MRKHENKIKVIFEGGQALDGVHGCNYMLGHYEGEDGSRQELYAEKIVPENLSENDAEDFGYGSLKAEIIRQAQEAGISEDRLEFR